MSGFLHCKGCCEIKAMLCRDEKTAAGGFSLIFSGPALVAAAKAFIGGVAGVASAAGLHHNAVQPAMTSFVVIGTAVHLASNGLTTCFGFVHILIPPRLMHLVFECKHRCIPAIFLPVWDYFPFFAAMKAAFGQMVRTLTKLEYIVTFPPPSLTAQKERIYNFILLEC